VEQRLPENKKKINRDYLYIVMLLPNIALEKAVRNSTCPSCDTEERKATSPAEFALGLTVTEVQKTR